MQVPGKSIIYAGLIRVFNRKAWFKVTCYIIVLQVADHLHLRVTTLCRSKKQYYIKPDITHQLLQAGFLKARIIIQIVTNQIVKSQNYTK
jgi:hypothetical protein